MKRRFVLPFLILSLFLAIGTASAAPESYQQFYQSEYEFGQFDGQTQELLSFEEGGESYIVEISDNSAVFKLDKPWGKLDPWFTFGSSGVDGAMGDFDNDGLQDVIICGTNSQIWFGNGDGTFGSPEPFLSCNGVAAGKLNNTYGDDLAVATNAGVVVAVHNPSNPSLFDVSQIISPTLAFNDVALGTLVGPELDLVAVTNNVEVVMNGLGDGTFADSDQPFLYNIGGNKVVMEDYNLDEYYDVFITSDTLGHAYATDDQGRMHKFVIPNFAHASTDVTLGKFDDEVGLDIVFSGEDRAYFYTGVALQDWGQTFIGQSSSVVTVNLDGNTYDDFIFGRDGLTNVPFKGGPERAVINIQETSYSFVAEVGTYDYDTMTLMLSGNDWRYLNISWYSSWLEIGQTNLSMPPSQTGNQFYVDANSSGLSPGEYNDTIRILTNDPENEIILIPVTLVVTAAKVSVTPSLIVETASIVGGQKQVIVTVSNPGTAGVWVYPSVDSNWMDIGGNFYLDAGESVDLTVTLTPAGLQPGTHNGQITLGNNKGYLENVVVNVEFTVTGTQVFLPVVIRP